MSTLENLTANDFRPVLNQHFSIRLADGSDYSLELIRIDEAGSDQTPEHRRSFSLLFRNPRTDGYLVQRIYRLEHPGLGALEVFIVPLGAHSDGMHYEIIFG